MMMSTTKMSSEQQRRLETLNKRPFSVKSNRPGTATSQADQQKENDQFTIEDDVYEEISVTEDDYAERMKLLKALDQRDRDHRALELENMFEELKKNANVKDNDDLETMTNVSIQEMKEMKEDRKQVNIYKPTLKGGKQVPPPVNNNNNFYPQLGSSDSKMSLDESQSSIMSDRIIFPDQPQFNKFKQQSNQLS